MANSKQKAMAAVLTAGLLVHLVPVASLATSQVTITPEEPKANSNIVIEEARDAGTVKTEGDGYTSIVILDGTEKPEVPMFTGEKEANYTEQVAPAKKYYPYEITNVDEDGDMLIVKSFRLKEEINPEELVETNINRKDHPYKRRDILMKQLKGTTDEIEASKTITITTDTKDKSVIANQMPSEEFYNEDGYKGQLYIDKASVEVVPGEKQNYSYTLKDVREYTNLDRMDTNSIAKTVNKNGVTLKLNDIDWQPMGSTVNGSGEIVSNYKAIARYSGAAYGTNVKNYTATAQYVGTVTKENPGDYIYSVIYAPLTENELRDLNIKLAEENKKDTEISAETKFYTLIFLLAAVAMGIFIYRNRKYAAEQAELERERKEQEQEITYEEVEIPEDSEITSVDEEK